MTLAEYERKAYAILAKARVDSPGLCARILTARAAGLSRAQYILAFRDSLTPEQAADLENMIDRRAAGEPLAYILGTKEFYSLEFLVSPATLIPRPETEMLVDLALEAFPPDTRIEFADLGSGTGCIALSLGSHRPEWRGIMIDLSQEALKISQQNLKLHPAHIRPVMGDLFHLPLASASMDLLVSNPPYIPRAQQNQVMAETLAYEPHCALFSGCEGYAHLQAVILQASQILKPDGILLLEHGYDQAPQLEAFLKQTGFTKIRLERDLAGLPRCILARWPGKK